MKRVLAVVLVAGAAALTAGFVSQVRAAPAVGTTTAVDIPVLRVGIVGTVSTLDPARGVSGSFNQLRALGYEGLMKIGADGVVRPHLALSVKQPNPNTVVITLRRGVKFWDGSEMTSADVANSLNYYRHKEFQTANFFPSVRDIKATARYTVQVSLKRRDVTYKNTLVFMSQIFSKKHADANAGQWGRPGVMPVATGPFRFVSLDPTRGAELVAFDQYWGGKPTTRRISVKFLADETSSAVAFRAGEIDVVSVGDARAFSSTSGAKLLSVPTCSAGLISMNVNQAPWNDVHVRRAVAYATDRAGIVRALGGSVVAAETPIPTTLWKGRVSKAETDKLYKALPKYPFNLTKARQELAQSRTPNGFSATIPAPAGLATIGLFEQVMVSNLEKIGIKLEIKNAPIGQWVAQFYGPRNDLGIFGTTSGCPEPADPSWYADTFYASKNAKTGGTNLADYKKPSVDTALATAKSTENGAKRLAAYGQFLRTVQTDVPYVFLFVQKFNLALNSKYTFAGLNPSSLSQSYPWSLSIKAKG